MAHTIEAIENVIVAAIKMQSGLFTINETAITGGRPNTAFASYRTLAYEGQDYPTKEYVGDPAEVITDTPYIQSRIQFVGKDAFSKLTKFCLALRSATRWKRPNANTPSLYEVVGLGGVEPVQNISIPDDTGTVIEQAVVNVNWYAEVAISEQIDAIDNGQVEVLANTDTINITTRL